MDVVSQGKRLFFVDYIRASVITLVILHHLAVVYAANTAFYYVEPTKNVSVIILLVLFQLSNQAWFMGLFFLISGYFSPLSFDHRGPVRFVRDRLVRLGIPVLAFSFLIGPLTFAIGVSHIQPALLANSTITLPVTWQEYPRFVNPGPMWFVILLLVFDLAYAAYRVAGARGWLDPCRQAGQTALPQFRTIAVYILLLAAASWLVRIADPIGTYVLFFPSLGYLPEYASFFIIGIVAFRNDWFNAMTGSMAKRLGIVALAATIMLFPLALRGGGAAFLGGVSWPAALYALWDATFAVGMVTCLIVIFRHIFNRDGRLRDFLYRHSYTVYVMHVLVITVIAAIVLQPVAAGPLAKFILAAAICVPLCWGFAYVVRKIPGADKIL